MKNVAIYVRVSTNKQDQLNSLETQREFFDKYCEMNNYNLVKVYADEGISGTKMKNRKALLKLLEDSKKGIFDTILLKDISRLARNTVDFLTMVRKLKSNGISVLFVNYNMNTEEVSEFMLTVMAGIAQEESANISKRVKFSKELNKAKGKVPNMVYGYDKIPNELFTLAINEKESEVVRRIYDMYVNGGYGANKIMLTLNKEGLKTKRGKKWSQEGISRILKNELYTGKVINGKETVKDFLTGERETMDESDWYVHHNEDLRIIDDKTYYKAQEILQSRYDAFKIDGKRTSNKYPFSKMIKCKHCGYSFRRNEKTYTNTYVWWSCSGRNANGKDSCPNKTKIYEEELVDIIKEEVCGILKDKEQYKKQLISKLKAHYKNKLISIGNIEELQLEVEELEKQKKKEMDMYRMDLVSLEELQEILIPITSKLEELNRKIALVTIDMPTQEDITIQVNSLVNDMDSLIGVEKWNNEMVRSVIDRIEVNKDDEIAIHIKPLY